MRITGRTRLLGWLRGRLPRVSAEFSRQLAVYPTGDWWTQEPRCSPRAAAMMRAVNKSTNNSTCVDHAIGSALLGVMAQEHYSQSKRGCALL